MQLSRWARASYETDQDLQAEVSALHGLVEVRPRREDAEIVVVNSSVAVDELLLDAAPSCRLVITTTSGTDHLDRPALAERGIRSARLPLARRDSVVEQSLCMALWGLQVRGTLACAAREGEWARGRLPALGPRLLRGATVGVVGCGVIGRRMVEVLQFLGARVLAHDPAGVPPTTETTSLETMAERSDVLTLHCSLTPQTRNLVGPPLLARAQRHLVLVNTARGACVDIEAALGALEAGQLGAVALDVFPGEPRSDFARLSRHPQALLSPHSSGYHEGLARAVRDELTATVRAFVLGEPLPHEIAPSDIGSFGAQAP